MKFNNCVRSLFLLGFILFFIFINTLLISSSTPGDITSCQKLNVSGTYTMINNLNESFVNNTGCFNITVSNVDLNCNNYFIRNVTLLAPAISVENATNITIRNCNISMNATWLQSSGINFSRVNYSQIINTTIFKTSYGLVLKNSNYNNYTNLTFLNMSYRSISGFNLSYSSFYIINSSVSGQNLIYLTNLSFSNISGITSNDGRVGGDTFIYLLYSNNSILSNISVKNHSGNSLTFAFSSFNSLYNFTSIDSDNNDGFQLDNAYYNNISLLNLTTHANGIYVSDSNYNNFSNFFIDYTTGSGITGGSSNYFYNGIANLNSGDRWGIYVNGGNYFYNVTSVKNADLALKIVSANNTFYDCNFSSTSKNDTYLTTALNNSIINCSYNLSREFVDTDSSLLRYWYLNSQINYSNGTSVNGANILVYNSSANLQNNLTTNGSGNGNRINLLQYINNGITRTNYSNYSINVTKAGYNPNFTYLNITANSNFLATLYDITSPSVTLSSPTTGSAYSGNSYSVVFIFDASDNSGSINNCSVFANGVEYRNTSAITDLNNNISVSLSSGSYSAYVNCTDFDGNIANSSSISFSITAPAVASSSGGGSGLGLVSFWRMTYDLSSKLILFGDNINYSLSTRERIKLNSSGNYIGLVNITPNSVIINIDLLNKNITLTLSEEKEFDLNNDGKYDIKIKLNYLNQTKVNLGFSLVNVVYNPEKESSNDIVENKNLSNKVKSISLIQLTYVALLVIILILIFLLVKRLDFRKFNIFKNTGRLRSRHK